MYSEKVMDHFTNPRNVGEIENASGVGTVGNAKCGDIMRIFLDIDDNGIIQDVKFKDAQIMTCGSLHDFVRKEGIDIAVITVPTEKAQIVADTVSHAGIKGIWNLTATDIEVPEGVAVENVHMSDSLHALVYYMQDTEE